MTRDALVHAFIAATLDETRAWPAPLQVALHEAAFTDLAAEVLSLRGPAARRWLRAWRARAESPPETPLVYEVPPEVIAWIAELAAAHRAAQAPAAEIEPPASADDLARLAALMERLGPLALALPWRREPPAQA
ncbi:MAG TPA: hypothetical protein VL172_09910 [Kofleriaceae bacterium]|jgi:hypothetical protein|nr:hypothetical protein [Kofleriaceae bacterium]